MITLWTKHVLKPYFRILVRPKWKNGKCYFKSKNTLSCNRSPNWLQNKCWHVWQRDLYITVICCKYYSMHVTESQSLSNEILLLPSIAISVSWDVDLAPWESFMWSVGSYFTIVDFKESKIRLMCSEGMIYASWLMNVLEPWESLFHNIWCSAHFHMWFLMLVVPHLWHVTSCMATH